MSSFSCSAIIFLILVEHIIGEREERKEAEEKEGKIFNT